MSGYKVVARYTENSFGWHPKTIGTQAKKATYVTYEDFKKYGTTVIKRWKILGWDIETYKMVDDKWIRIELDE